MKILIAGDLLINKEFNVNKIDQSVIDLFLSADYRIVNVEAPVTESNNKIVKVGPNLKMEAPNVHSFFSLLNIDCAALANNHINDYGEKGVLDTIEFFGKNNFHYMGAGSNAKEAGLLHKIKTNEGRVGFINIAENEWATATSNRAGANGMNFIKDFYAIQEAKKECDYVIVIVHGGHEYYSLPSPRMQEQYRFYVEQGADLVVGHHTHCISGTEKYKKGEIFYSLGNFLFTKASSHDVWYQGLVLEINIENGEITSQLHPVFMERDGFGLSLNQAKNKKDVLKHVSELSQVITEPSHLQREWHKYIDHKSKSYLSIWSLTSFIENRYLRGVVRRVARILSPIYGWKRSLNFMRCEAHKDLSCAVLQKKLDDNK